MKYEERVEKLHHKMEVLDKKRTQKVIMIQTAAAFAACLVLSIASALMIWRFPVSGSVGIPGSMTGSVFTENGALGYIMVAIISLCLGISFTLFCVLLRKRMKGK